VCRTTLARKARKPVLLQLAIPRRLLTVGSGYLQAHSATARVLLVVGATYFILSGLAVSFRLIRTIMVGSVRLRVPVDTRYHLNVVLGIGAIALGLLCLYAATH
jgi:hypothetical protein